MLQGKYRYRLDIDGSIHNGDITEIGSTTITSPILLLKPNDDDDYGDNDDEFIAPEPNSSCDDAIAFFDDIIQALDSISK